MYIFESSGTTNVEVVRIKYKWTINNFSCCLKNVGEALQSPIFSGGTDSNHMEWYLELYPFGLDENDKKCITIYLHLLSFNTDKVEAKYKISILNVRDEETSTFENSSIFTKEHNYGYFTGKTQNWFLSKANDFLPNDRLTIICNITASVGYAKISKKSITLQNCLKEDFASLLKNSDHSDFIVFAGGKEFKTHKAILAARSPVFKAMLESNMKENKINRVELEESEEVVSKMLNYIYTEKASKEMATELLPLADRYLLDGLKILCEKALCESLSIENSVQFFVLGHMYSADQLKDQAKDFILAHASNLVKTTEFISMFREYPNLGAEIFSAIVD